jgi:hypothetical protein
MSEIDRELIQMCDVSEIQDRWELKRGDQYVYRLSGKSNIIVKKERSLMIRERKHKFVYIPRIEDVLEWLVPYKEHVDMKDNWVHWLDITIKAALDLFMHLEHNKTWNGERWE